MSSPAKKFLKNAVSNIINGGSSAILAIVLPSYLSRFFHNTEFSLWILIIQLGAYVNYLNFGVQTAIGRFVAFAVGRDDKNHAQEILGSGLQVLSLLGCGGMIVVGFMAGFFPALFHSVPPQLLDTARESLLWIGAAFAIGLPFSAFLGVFVGLQRNELTAIVSSVGKAALGIGLIFAAREQNLLLMAKVYFAISLLTYLFQYLLYKVFCPQWRIIFRNINSQTHKELFSYCVSLTAWSLGMLLVNGISTTLVGIFDFSAVGAFGTAVTALNFFVGLVGAIFAPLIQIFAQMHARQDLQRVLKLLEISAIICTVTLLIGTAWLIVFAKVSFNLWIGENLAQTALPLFIVLLIANIIRTTQTPFSLYLIATGQQKRVMLTPVFEGVTNLLISLVALHFWGAMGVALGAIAGSFAGLAANFLYNFPRTLPASFDRNGFIGRTIYRPLLLASPIFLAVILGQVENFGFRWTVIAMLAAHVSLLFYLPQIKTQIKELKSI